MRSLIRLLQTLKFAKNSGRGILRGNEGGAFVELALLVSFFAAPLLMGTAETGFMLYDSIEVENAAHTGAMYGMMSSTFAADSTGIQTAAQEEAPDLGTNLTVTPTTYYACSAAIDGTQYSSQAAATAACSGAGNHGLQFVQVAATAVVPLPIRVPGILPGSVTLSNTSVMEVQE
ncbi:MAG TPA: TadE family protein [Terracidiphilus sp.]|nr:TadE family protein [Terracidiphilus sp.]